MKRIVFALPGNEALAQYIGREPGARQGKLIVRAFPDGESYVRIADAVSGKEVILVCTLDRPDAKLLPLLFTARTMKEMGAKKITLVSPYLAYMRQDKRFKPGEAVTSLYFAGLLSSFSDELITIDPHLHRRRSLSEIYSIPCRVIHATSLIADYIRDHMPHALVVGPDSESEQWVSQVARGSGSPYIVLQKKRLGDTRVRISAPQVKKYRDHTPVLVDDIISTAHTMIETVSRLKKTGMPAPVCIGVHGIFSGTAYEELKAAGASDIVTCNSIPHASNKIDLNRLIAKALSK
ncbi:MAG: ribose-phosphate pyrophosphokinase [Bacteroidota bacterium]